MAFLFCRDAPRVPLAPGTVVGAGLGDGIAALTMCMQPLAQKLFVAFQLPTVLEA